MVFGTSRLLAVVPTGFLPDEDEGYFIVDVSLPPGASLLRTDQVNTQAEAIVKELPGVENYFSLAGQSLVSNIFASNLGTLFVVLKPWEERHGKEPHASAHQPGARPLRDHSNGARVIPYLVPPIKGLGSAGGFNMKVQDRGGNDVGSLARATNLVIEAARQRPEIGSVATPFSVNEPQLWLELDRERCKILGVPIADAFQALQTYLGGLYINDFNLYGRTFRVVMQAEAQFRQTPEDLERFYVRSTSGRMVPVSEVVTLSGTNGPLVLNRFQSAAQRRHFWRPGVGLQLRAGPASHGRGGGQGVAPWLYLRLDDHGLSGEGEGGTRGAHLCVRHRAGVSVTGGTV